jgi:hypothetical protein
MAEITRLEYFAGLAMQTMMARNDHDFHGANLIAAMAFEVAQAMDAEAAKHNPDDLAQARGMLEAEEFAKQQRAQFAHREALQPPR